MTYGSECWPMNRKNETDNECCREKYVEVYEWSDRIEQNKKRVLKKWYKSGINKKQTAKELVEMVSGIFN